MPSDRTGDCSSGEGKETQLDREEGFRTATSEPCANLIGDIVGHPKGQPSLPELIYMNPDLNEKAIRRELDHLTDLYIINKSTIPGRILDQEDPIPVYELTDEARQLFDREGIFYRDAWVRQYTSVLKTKNIQALEDLSRPHL